MTPKEKAEQLFIQYRSIIAGKQFATGFVLMSEAKELTKRSALIAVDELLEFENRVIEEWRNYFEGKGGSMKVERIFWEEVKHEIEKL